MNEPAGGKPKFVYVTYIRTTADKLWAALTRPEFTRRFWFDTTQDCEWRPGSSWRLMAPDGRIADAGEVLEADPPRRLVLTCAPDLSARAAGRHGQAHADARGAEAGVQVPRLGVGRLAGHSREPEKPYGNWRAVGM